MAQGVDVCVTVAVGGAGVLVRVLVGPAVVGVLVGVFVPQLPVGRVNITTRPWVNPPALHSNEVNRLPVSRCTPTDAPVPAMATGPYTKSKRFCPSYRRASKLVDEVVDAKNTARHSMLKMRLGATPVTEV